LKLAVNTSGYKFKIMSKIRKFWSIEILSAVGIVAVAFVGAIGWLSQEAEAAKCLDCDERITNEVSGAEPACIYGIFSCPPWAGGHSELTADSAFFCPDCREYPIP
jgi:hypothetical protein